MKRDALDSTKMKRLARRLDLPRYAAIGLMESLWKLAERDAPQGDIGKLTNEDIAVSLDWRGDENDLIAALVQCGWLDETEYARLWVHDWNHHCEDSVHARLARAHQLFANGVIPHTGKLKKEEKAAADYHYAAAAKAKAAAAGSRREPPGAEIGKADASGSQPLPSPSPSHTKPIAPPMAAAAEDHPITGDMVAQSVMFELRISGRELRNVLDDVCRAEIRHGEVPGELRDRMVAAWHDYTAAVANAQLEYPTGAPKFFGEGRWKDRNTWPWKTGVTGNGTNQGNRTKAQQRSDNGNAAIFDAWNADFAGEAGVSGAVDPDEGELPIAGSDSRDGGAMARGLDGTRIQARNAAAASRPQTAPGVIEIPAVSRGHRGPHSPGAGGEAHAT